MSPPPRVPGSRVANVALAVSFLAAIAAPMLVQVLGLNTARLDENRKRVARPELNLRTLKRFPARFEAYFNDSFGLRDPLIRWNNLAKVRLLGASPSSTVLIGSRGWLYYADDSSLDDYRHSRPLTVEQLERWRRAFVARRDWLASRGIRYLIMFAPSKHTIYPEHFPAAYRRVHAESRYDQIYNYLREHTDLPLLDLRAPLLEAKAEGRRLYYRHDTHWNDLGAFVAYRAIMDALGRWYPGARALPRSSFRPVRLDQPPSDLALMLGLKDMLPDHDYGLKPRFARRARWAPPSPGLSASELPPGASPPEAREVDGAELPRAVVFRDSFFIALIPFLSEHFARSLYVWQRPEPIFDPAIIERERPQIVIEEAVERRLWHDPPEPGLPETWLARKTIEVK